MTQQVGGSVGPLRFLIIDSVQEGLLAARDRKYPVSMPLRDQSLMVKGSKGFHHTLTHAYLRSDRRL